MKSENNINKKVIEKIVLKMSQKTQEKTTLEKSYHELTEERLWEEIVRCILGSRVRNETVNSAFKHLLEENLLQKEKIVDNPKKMEDEISKELKKPIFSSGLESKSKYPFYNSRPEYIVESAKKLYGNGENTVQNVLKRSENEKDARQSIKEKSKGLGLKQSSLFLRNISYSKNLAVLDTHVIDYMDLMNISKEIEEYNLAIKKDYLAVEKELQRYAFLKGKNLSSLDLAIWIVMKLLKKEYNLCQ